MIFYYFSLANSQVLLSVSQDADQAIQYVSIGLGPIEALTAGASRSVVPFGQRLAPPSDGAPDPCAVFTGPRPAAFTVVPPFMKVGYMHREAF